MRQLAIVLLALVTFGVSVPTVSAVPILNDWAVHIDDSLYVPDDTVPGLNDLGFSWSEGIGRLSWTTAASGAHHFYAFFDHEFENRIESFTNEWGTATSLPAPGQSWEIDEPGFVFGDIYAHVVAGSLDNTNGVPEALEDDVSMAIGWDFSLTAGETATIELHLGEQAPASGFYLSQTDSYENEKVCFWSSLKVESPPPSVPEPGTAVLLVTGLMGMLGLCRIRGCK